jgi:hypothetical protein
MRCAERAATETKDLPPKSPTKVKGGKIALNDNITLVQRTLSASASRS